MNEQARSDVRDSLTFPLFEGGPFHRLLERMRLVETGRSLIFRRILMIVFVTWTPLVMLALAQGFALRQRAEQQVHREDSEGYD